MRTWSAGEVKNYRKSDYRRNSDVRGISLLRHRKGLSRESLKARALEKGVSEKGQKGETVLRQQGLGRDTNRSKKRKS